MTTTVGQLLINEALPEDMRDYTRVWNKDSSRTFLETVARTHPELYKDILFKLNKVGASASTTGNVTVTLKDFMPMPGRQAKIEELRQRVTKALGNPGLSTTQRREILERELMPEVDPMIKGTLAEGLSRGSQLAEIVSAGSKGKPDQYNNTVGALLMFEDAQRRIIPLPIFSSVASGMNPAEYWASSYGTRRGILSTKHATAEAGYLGKKLGLGAHRLVVTEDDCGTHNGILVKGDDPDNVGTILQMDAGGLKAGTILDARHLKQLAGITVPVRSVITCQSHKGICSKCSGIRESGGFPDIGTNVGTTVAMALSEKFSQMALNTKHQGGAVQGKRQYGFADVDRLYEMPKHSPNHAAVSGVSGQVDAIKPAPAGGVHIIVGGKEHWAPQGSNPTVKIGDMVDAGDVLSDGLPNPQEVAAHKGIGATRRAFVDYLREVTSNSINRRSAEVLGRATIKHVRVTNPDGIDGTIVDDVVGYDDLVRDYKPRPDAQTLSLAQAKGQYLEQPLFHYTIGTKVDNRMVKDLSGVGVKDILVHKDEPGFVPDVQRLYVHANKDPDWMTRFAGYGLKDSLLDSAHRGMTSLEHSTSYVPATAKAINVGKDITLTGEY